jgi:hypothetical protein
VKEASSLSCMYWIYFSLIFLWLSVLSTADVSFVTSHPEESGKCSLSCLLDRSWTSVSLYWK